MERVYVVPSEKIEVEQNIPAAAAPSDVVTEQLAASTPNLPIPRSIEEVILGLRGFGIENNEEILTFTSKNGKRVQLRITNIPIDEELESLVSAEEFKGYAWVQRIRVEILSHSISWIDGIDIRSLREKKAVVRDLDGVNRDIQIVLRNIILGWGQELVTTLWKIAMVHSDKIEKRYQSEFPDSIVMTDVERRFMETVLKEIADTSKEIISDSVQQLFETDDKEETK